MVFGMAMMAVGYSVFYWGLHHMPQYKNQRISLWTALGIGSVTPQGQQIPGAFTGTKNPVYLPQGQPIKFQA